MNKNIANPIAVAMLLLVIKPVIGSAMSIRNKLANTNLQLSRPKHRSMISLMLIVTLSASVLMSMVPFEAQAAGGAYTLTWRAADPSSYQKYTPATLACPGNAGRYADPLPNASSLNVVTSLAPSTLALGQIVPFEMIIGVEGDTSPENGVIQFTNKFATNTSSGDNFGYDPAYKVYCAFVDTADPGTNDLGNNAKVDNFTSTLVGSGSNQYIQGTFNVSGLDNGDQVVVEIWVVLESTIPPKSSGTVSAIVDSAQTASGDKINSGQQSTDINKIGQFFTNEADVSVVKTDISDPVIQGQTLNYTLLVKNNSPDTVANGISVTDTLDANTTFVSAAGAPYTLTGNTLIFNVGFLNPGQSTTLTINTIVSSTAWADNDTSPTNPEQGSTTPPTIPYDLLNIVSVTAITSDPNTANNTYYQPTNVLPALVPNPALQITKSADPQTYNAVDQTITYTYIVTNIGNVPVSDIAVTDDKATVTIDSGTLAPKASVTGTATYKITQDDINAGSVTNTAFATGTFAGSQVKSTEAKATVKKVTSTGQICPTGTTCDQYMSGTAADLTQANYFVDSKTKSIKSVSPGVMFYYSTITIPAGGPSTTTVSVTQLNNSSISNWPFIAIQDTKQVILYSSSCSKIAGTKVTIDGSTVTLKVNNLPAGTYYLGIKYSLSSLQGFKPITQPYPTVKYTFKTSLNGSLISTSEDSIDLIPKK